MNPNISSRLNTHAARRALAWALGCGVAVLVPLMAPGAASAFGTFSPKDTYATPGLVGQAAFGDLDGNGTMDVAATADEQPGDAGDGLYLYFGNGDGTLGVPLPIAAGDGPGGVAIGRFSGDGRRDVAVASEGDSISLLHTQQGGGFDHGPTLKTPAGPFLLQAADLNRDGRTDLVSVNYFADEAKAISIWLQRSGGGFAARRDYSASGSSFRGLAVGRINGDKRPDVAVLSQGDDVSVHLTKKDGTLGPKTVVRNPGFGGFADLAIADFDRDGKGDLVVGESAPDNALHVRLGKGNGRFRRDHEIILAAGHASGLATGDFNRDGKADIGVAIYSPGRVVTLLGKGNGKFGPESAPLAAASQGFWLGAARLNADKGLDLVFGGRSAMDVFLNVP
jgi:hypothetical protein